MVGEPLMVCTLSASNTFASDSAEVEVDVGSETSMSMSPYDVFSGASIGVAIRVYRLESICTYLSRSIT